MENLDVFMTFYDYVETLWGLYNDQKCGNVESTVQTRLFIHVYTVKKKKVEPT